MKRYTTRFFKSVALFYMAFPATYLLLAALLFDIPAAQCLRMLLSPWYYLICLIASMAGYGLWETRRWAWYVFLFANILIGYNDAILVSDFVTSHHKVLAFVLSILVQISLILRVAREVRVPYFLPKIRWWESNPRYRLVVPVHLGRSHAGQEFNLDGEILDISLGGCFVKIRADLAQDETITLRFTIFGQPIELVGAVVWRTQSAVTHPGGVGVKFGPMARYERKVLRAATQRLREISVLYRTSRYLLNQDDFLKKMQELQGSPLKIPVKPSREREKGA